MFYIFFIPTASATAYGQRPKFFRAEHSAMAEGENCAYGPTLIFYPIFKDHFFVFEEVFSENSVLIYGLYSRAAYDGARTVSDLYLDHYQDQLLSIGQFLTIVLLHHLLTKYKIYMIRSLPMNQKNNSY